MRHMGPNREMCKQCRIEAFPHRYRKGKGRKSKGRHYPPKTFKGTYKEYMRSQQWKRKRQEAIDHHGNWCNRCGAEPPTPLQVHHITYDRLFQELMDDLEVLCGGCHRNEHEGKNNIVADPMTEEYTKLMRRIL